MEPDPVRHTFFSADHPGGRSKPAIAGSALVRPLGFCMIPVMIGALFSMLQGFVALPYLTVGFPIAAASAMIWTWIRVRSVICEIHIHEESVAVRSLFDAALPSTDLEWKRIIDVDQQGRSASVTIGLSSFRIQQGEWPEWPIILRSLGTARQFH
jgi:hypothetical protein